MYVCALCMVVQTCVLNHINAYARTESSPPRVETALPPKDHNRGLGIGLFHGPRGWSLSSSLEAVTHVFLRIYVLVYECAVV